ncbi:MAG: tetratricopeptide repeat protein [Succinivibrionaceae bacterium]|nr:tetratricopeptide repeat protein [Succinivibrionaceae bacterium]
MSVINTMLKDLDKRQKLQDDGVYHPAEQKSNFIVYVLAVLVAVLLLIIIGGGIWYYLRVSGNPAVEPAKVQAGTAAETAVTESVSEKNVITAAAGTEPSGENVSEEDMLLKENSDEQTLEALENEIYGPDTNGADITETYEDTVAAKSGKPARVSNTAELPKNNAVSSGRKVMKVTPVELTKEQEIDLDSKAANIALSQGNIDKAIESYQAILVKDPKNRMAREKIASLFYGTNNLAQAKKILQQGISIDSTYPNYRLLLARILVEQDSKNEALSVLASLSLKADRSNLDYLATEAYLATELNQSTLAVDAYSKLTRIMPNEGKWWFGLGLAFDRQKVKPAAVSNYKKAVSVGIAEASRKFALQRIQELEK